MAQEKKTNGEQTLKLHLKTVKIFVSTEGKYILANLLTTSTSLSLGAVTTSASSTLNGVRVSKTARAPP